MTAFSDPEAELMSRLIEAHPGALGYHLDRDEPVREAAANLIEDGFVVREEDEDVAVYRLGEDYIGAAVEQYRERSGNARWN